MKAIEQYLYEMLFVLLKIDFTRTKNIIALDYIVFNPYEHRRFRHTSRLTLLCRALIQTLTTKLFGWSFQDN